MKINDVTCSSKPVKERLLKFLQNAPADEVYTTTELARMLSTDRGTLGRTRCLFKKYTIEAIADHGYTIFWGAETAIAKLKKQIQ